MWIANYFWRLLAVVFCVAEPAGRRRRFFPVSPARGRLRGPTGLMIAGAPHGTRAHFRGAGVCVFLALGGPAFAGGAPLLSSPAVAPSALSYRGGAVTLSVAIQGSGAGGVQTASATVQLPDGTTTTVGLSLTAGGATSGTWQGQYTIPTNFGSASGLYNVSFSARDGAGNSAQTPPVPITVAPPGASDPSIQLTSIPAFGSYNSLSGLVTNAPPESYQIAILIFVEGLGWYSKPYCTPLFTAINPDGTWSASITTGGVDNTATQIAVYLVPSGGSSYTCVTAGGGLPASLESTAVAKVLTTRTDPNLSVIQFAGMSWWVKSNTVPLGPGPTYFSSMVNNPFVDGSGHLHLKLIQSGGIWYGAEVVSNAVLGNGTFSFSLDTDETGLDPNVVVGLYTWNDAPAFANREIDVELGRFGNANDTNNAQFVVQPFETSGNLLRFAVPKGTAPSSYGFQWYPTAVSFEAAQGLSADPANPQLVIKQWVNSQTVPQPGNANVRMNVWLYNASAPANSQPVEVIVDNFQFTPLTVTANSVSPTAGSGIIQTFTTQYSDSAGVSDLNGVQVWFNSSLSPGQTAGSCLLFYSPVGNQLYLENDAGSGWLGPSPIGGAVPLSNSQCGVNAQSASVVMGSNQLTLNLPMTFASGFGGTKNIYGFASGVTVPSGWQTLGTWAIPTSQLSQTITFGALSNVSFSAIPVALSATATSGLTVTFASNTPSVCVVSGASVTLLSTGICSITASQSGDSAYLAAAPVTQTFTVTAEAQTITFGALSNQTLGSTAPALSATAGSGLVVTFISNSAAVCTVSGVNVTLVAVGTCSIVASQAGNAIFAAATPVTQVFTVSYPCATISACAYQVVNQRAAANQTFFYVYLDADSAFNHGFASGLFFTGDVNPSSVVIDPGCLDAATSASGCATDPNLIDRTRGTVFRISFPSLGPSDYVGLNFQDPQNYVAGDGSSGYNLTPSTAVQFDVRSPGGAVVQFGVGGCVTGFYRIGPTWQTLSIPLNALYPPPGGSTGPCPPDITNTNILFTITTNGGQQTAASTVLLDNIQFTPVPARQTEGQQALSLPISTQTFGVIPQTASPIPPDQANRNVAAIYESALAIITLLKRGQSGDIANALKIADAMDYALHHDNHGDPVPPGSDGSVGLHSAYMAGDIGLLNKQSTGAQAGDARLAGFSGGTTLCGATGFCLVLDGATGGNNAWAIFGLVSAYLQSGKANYLTDAETIGDWIINRLQDQAAVGLHGYFVGFNDASAAGLQQPNLGKSTENNGDIFGAFSLLSQVEAARGNSTTSLQWLAAANVAGEFVSSMQIPGGGFYVGTVTATDAMHPAAGNCPSTAPAVGNDVINVCEFIDSDTFTILPMAAATNFRSIDWVAALQHVLNYSVAGATYTQTVTTAGQTYQGFDLVPAPAGTGVAFEFTGQVTAACSYLDSLLLITTFQNCGNTYPLQIANAQASAPFGDGSGLVASVLTNVGSLTPVGQCLATPFQCIPERVGLAATTWAIIADQKFNPMAYPGAFFSPSTVNFGSQTTGTASPAAVVTLTNAGTAPMTISQISITGANAADFKETDNCVQAAMLAPAPPCTINITFQPLAAGTRTAFLSLVTNGFAGPLALSGLAVPVDDFRLSLSPASQSVNAGGSTSFTVSTSITKGGSQAVTLSAGGLPAGATASFAANPISSGASTQLTISTATSTAPGAFTLTVSGTGTETLQTASAAITIQPTFTPLPTALTFASQTVDTTSGTQSIAITNPDTSTLPLSILVTGVNSGEFTQTNNCPSFLPASGSCSVSVSFTPAGTGPRSAWLQIESTATAGQMISLKGVGAGACLTISACAFQLLSQRVSLDAGGFFVYKDADSGFNHGTPSGVFASGVDTSAVIINAGCVDLATSPTGCSADPNALDETRGTVLSITFPDLIDSQFAGLNIQEPSNYSATVPSAGYNLTPANAVRFDVRSPGGATMQFGVGGCVSGFYQIGPTWQTLSISLSTLQTPSQSSVACPPDITNTNILFTVTTNSSAQAAASTVLLDNIQFMPVPSRQASAISLPLSTQTFGVPPQQDYPIPTDQVNRNLATTYESALTMLALFGRGQVQDISSAMNVANGLDYALHHDNHGDPIPVANGSTGLHSSYEAGDLAFLNPQAPSVGAGQAGDVRLSGFSASASLCGTTQFCLVLDGATGGNNAWAILALAAAFEHTGNPNYLEDAEAIGNWVAALADTSGTGFGGYYLGYSDGGTPKELQVGKSTEQNADIFAAFTVLAQIESLRGNSALAASWTGRAKTAGDFVIQMFDSVNGRFNDGTVNNIFTTGPGPGICPSAAQIKGTDTINTCDFLDANTAPILAMSGTAAYQNAINWSLPAQYLSTFSQTVAAAGGSYQGFGLINASPRTGVGWEFTAQAVAAYETGLLPNSSSLVTTYLQEIAAAQNAAPFGDGLGVVAATLQNGDIVTPANQCLNTPFECVPERVGLAATSWAALADQKVNPMSPGVTPIVISPLTLNFGSQQVGSAAPVHTVSLTNSWSVPVTLTVSITGTNAGDFSQTGCPTMLAAGASCVLSVGFIPIAVGLQSASVSIAQTPSWATLAATSIVTLSGMGTPAAPQTITLATSPAGLLVSVDGGAAQASPFTVNLSSGLHTIAVASTQAGSTGTQFVFTGWSDSGAASHSITVGSSPATYTAAFKTQYQLTTAASPFVGGTVTPPNGTFHDAGSVVTVQAASNAGYQFANFSGALTGSTNPQILTMTQAANVVANFTPLAPNLAATVGARTVAGSNLLVSLTLTNTGLGAATNATITSITSISDVAGSGSVTVASGTPTDLGTIDPNSSATATVTFTWPLTAARVSFTVNFIADGGYTGSTRITTLY
jgi:hypothetical protein